VRLCDIQMYIDEFSSLVWCMCARTPYSKQNIFSYLVFVCCAYTYTFSDVHVCVCMFVCASVLIVYVCDTHHLFVRDYEHKKKIMYITHIVIELHSDSNTNDVYYTHIL
jgi:hypothetical protein